MGLSFTVRVDATGLERTFQTIATSVKDLNTPLRIFDAYLRAKVQQRFASEGPGWPQRKASTDRAHHRDEQVHALAVHKLTIKLQREFRRARQRFARGGGSLAAKERRYAVLKEFERQVAGGILGRQIDKGDKRLEKSVAGLRERFGRAEEAASEKLLGRMASSIASKINKGTLTVYSKIPWSGAHNEGAVTGHGATLPPRPFLFLEDEDLDALAEILINHCLLMVE